MIPPVVEHRRALHRIPELDCQLPETVRYVETVLRPLGCKVFSPTQGSLCAWFDAGREETAAFRADMDALPGEETTGLPYTSAHLGRMHACGHDGHTAMALGLAEWVSAHLEELPRNVLFLFQPAEESSGGAKPLCDVGILARYRVARIFGLHLWPGLPAGAVFSRPGPLMARSNEVTVTVEGLSVHLSRAAQGRDALAAGVDFLCQVNGLLEALPPPVVLRFGKMTSGTVRNAVSGHTELLGSLRTYSEATHRACRDGLEAIAQAVAAESGCTVHVHLSEGYPAVWNHEGLYAAVCAGLKGDSPSLLDAPVLAAEDFSVYQQAAPGVFFFLGVGDTPELHAADFAFDDEAILPKGVEFLKKLAVLP